MKNKSNKKERGDIISAENRIITRTPTNETNEKKSNRLKNSQHLIISQYKLRGKKEII